MARNARWVELAAVITLITTTPALSAIARPDPGDPSPEQSVTAVARANALSYEPNRPLGASATNSSDATTSPAPA
jgi:hypothetical protein